MAANKYDIETYGALFDAHTHTYFDFHDGLITPKQLIQATKKWGYNYVCAMSHDTCRGAPKIKKMAKDEGLPCVTGIEISTTHNHLLAYGLHEWNIRRDTIDPDEAIELLREQDAAIFLSHPYTKPKSVEYGNWPPEIVKRLDIDGIEWHNATTYFFNRKTKHVYRNFPQGRRIAGTDAHHISCFGYAFTQVDVNSEDVDDLVSAMQKGKCTPYSHPVPLHKFLGGTLIAVTKNKILRRKVVEGRPIVAEGDRPHTIIADSMNPHINWVKNILSKPIIPRVNQWIGL